jgi:hypothetical protein
MTLLLFTLLFNQFTFYRVQDDSMTFTIIRLSKKIVFFVIINEIIQPDENDYFFYFLSRHYSNLSP